MKIEEIYDELALSYDELVKHLLKKYGSAKYDYFCTPACKSRKNSVSRTNEGLICHHMDEDKGGNLSKPYSAALQPFEWQKKERLVYCNYIEHLILHIKIAILRQKAPLKTPTDILDFFTTGGIYQICEDLNDLYIQKGSSLAWQQRCYKEITENYSDYLTLVKLLMYYIKQQYIGEKCTQPFLREGAIVKFGNCEGVIVQLDKLNEKMVVKTPDQTLHSYPFYMFFQQFTFDDAIYDVTKKISTGKKEFRASVFEHFSGDLDDTIADRLYPLLLIDFHGYGFPQFSMDSIDNETYGCSSIDEYVSRAFPSYSDPSYNITHIKPTFWTGRIPQKVTRNKFFYIIRVQAVFKIKDGEEPFIQYKERTPWRMNDESFGGCQHNFLTFRDGRIVSSSFVYNKDTDKYYAAYYQSTSRSTTELVDSDLIISMTKEDYVLFKKKYHVLKCKVLDGCYFER